MRLSRFIQTIRKTPLRESYERWITTWTVPGQTRIFSEEGSHHEEMARSVAANLGQQIKGSNEYDYLKQGWVRGGYYKSAFNDHIYLEFDEDAASKRDVNRSLQYLSRLFRKETGYKPDSVYTPGGEILLRNFPMIISDLKESFDQIATPDTQGKEIPVLIDPSPREFEAFTDRASEKESRLVCMRDRSGRNHWIVWAGFDSTHNAMVEAVQQEWGWSRASSFILVRLDFELDPVFNYGEQQVGRMTWSGQDDGSFENSAIYQWFAKQSQNRLSEGKVERIIS